ncbi:MAG: hypothetical protein ABL308_14330 [Oceanicaulis sp.]
MTGRFDIDTDDGPSRCWRDRPIVVCDPSRFNRRLTVDILRHAGASKVTPADTPATARWFLGQSRDPLLVAGWNAEAGLGEGPDLIRALRLSDRNRRAPAVIVTGRSGLFDIERVRDSGADALALRPVAPKTLAERLAEIAARPRRFVETARFSGPDRRADRPMRGDFKRGADVAAGLVAPVEAARNEARSIVFESLRRRDPMAARVGRSLERYLGAVTTLDDRASEIVDLHRATLAKLSDARGADTAHKLDVIAGLERIVERRAAA